MKNLYRSLVARDANAEGLDTPEGRLMYQLGLVRLSRADAVARRANGNNGFTPKPPRADQKT